MIYDRGAMGKVWEGKGFTTYGIRQLWNYCKIDNWVSFYSVHSLGDSTVILLLYDSLANC